VTASSISSTSTRRSVARNGKIVRLINKFPDPPNKDVGEGLDTARQKMHALGLVAPVVTEQGDHVVVFIRHERLASHEEQIIEYCSNSARSRTGRRETSLARGQRTP